MLKSFLPFFLFNLLIFNNLEAQSRIRINQIGYLPNDSKVAVWVTKDASQSVQKFELCDALTERVVFSSTKIQSFGKWGAFEKAARLDFSAFNTEGGYFLKIGDTKSPFFRINNDVYNGSADFLLRYLRQQRCGFNPTLKDSCHTHGGYVVYGDSAGGKYGQLAPYPIFGGWHDASDYLQYVPTTATAVFQLLFAYENHPSVFSDEFQANGLKGANGIPDIIDEAKWGMDWLILMNPEANVMFNQVCDDRDHRGMRMPNKDTFTYDIAGSRARPVYRITGKPQGLFKYQNRTEGVSSSAAKFCSAFAIGSRVLSQFYPEYARKLKVKAIDAYEYALSDTGRCQTAPCRAPYFYEEDDWRDDMALAAAQLKLVNLRMYDYMLDPDSDFNYYQQAQDSTWFNRDSARHYQFYPFAQLAPYVLAKNTEGVQKPNLSAISDRNLSFLKEKAAQNPFGIGTPSIWCSNNYVSAAATMGQLHDNLTGGKNYQNFIAAHRDWLFGCNPFGTSMIIGLPNAKIGATTEGVFPRDPHSAFTHNAKIQIDGGLVDGPLRGSIFGKLIGLTLYNPDEFAEFQSKEWVYHDDYGDYSTNEPTMDGTASLAYFLAAQEAKGRQNTQLKNAIQDKFGATTRLDSTQKTVYLVFTGHDFAEGGDKILRGLNQQKAKAAFFLTGDFLRKNKRLAQKIIKNGHYLGGHSDKHLLYCDWTKRDSTLISRSVFKEDLKANFAELEKLGVQKQQAQFFISPFEWYNDSIALWTKQAGLTLLNFTAGTGSNADYTTPSMKNYKSSQQIFDNILNFEITKPNGLNGAILLLHIGASNERKDKFFDRLEELITVLRGKGYDFGKF
jgi:endoglucanase